MNESIQNIDQVDEKGFPVPSDIKSSDFLKQNSTESKNIFLTKIKHFLFAYKWLLLSLILIIICAFIIHLLFLGHSAPPTQPAKQQIIINSTPSPEQSEVSPKISPVSQLNQPTTLADEVNDIAFGKLRYMPSLQKLTPGSAGSEFAGTIINKISLGDGSIQYEYASTDPKRPHMQIVKDGIVIFRRSLMTNTPISNYSEFITNPPYASEGSSYFGPNAVILANPSQGIAIVYNPDTNYVYEQYLFKAMSVTNYGTMFGDDISAYNPTL